MADDPILDQARREACRHDTLGFLAERQMVAHHANTVRNRLNAGHQHDYTDAEIGAALAFLVGAGLGQVIRDPLGATPYYQATSAGVLQHERG